MKETGVYTANHSQPRVVVRRLSDILANTVNQRANIKQQKGIVCPYRESQGLITQTKENADRDIIYDKSDATDQTNCRDEFAPILVRSKERCMFSTAYMMDT